MPQPVSSPSKKRKHEGGEPASLHKKPKKDGKRQKAKGSKADGQFQVINASIVLSIPPKFALDPLSGAKEMLDSLVMRYVPVLNGVMLCHSNARFDAATATLKNECPFLVCTVNFDASVWSPKVGMKLTGRINLCSPDHISLLVHRTFNVSIPREHIPSDNWAFEYGPAENDPEFGPFAHGTDGNEVAEADAKQAEEPHGIWVHKVTGDRLGGNDGQLEFTVIGMTVANQMLSLKGSLQPDPFSPAHVRQPAVPIAAHVEVEKDDEDDRNEVEEVLGTFQDPDDSAEEDPFSHLGRAREEAMEVDATEKKRTKEEKTKAKEEKKRRKKEKKERKEREKALAAVNGTTQPEASAKDEKPHKAKRKKGSQES